MERLTVSVISENGITGYEIFLLYVDMRPEMELLELLSVLQ